MGMHGIKRIAVLCLFSALVPAAGRASFGPQGSGERREPPQEAFDACKDKSEGAAVEIVTPRGDTIKATCKKFKDQLVAVPEGAPSAPPEGGGSAR